MVCKFIIAPNTAIDQVTTFTITDTKLCALVVTLSTRNNAEPLQHLKSNLRIDWNKYQSKVTTQVPKPCLDYFIDTSIQGVNRFFVSSPENNTDRTVYT